MKDFYKIKRKQYHVVWARSGFMRFGNYKEARERMRMKVQKQCVKCSQKFESDDILGLVCFKGLGNKLACHKCTIEPGGFTES